MSDLNDQQLPPAPFMRRLASWVYDLLTGTAIVMLSTVVFMILVNVLEMASIIDMSGHEDTAAYLQGNIAFQLFLLICLTAFFCYFWVRGGQTIGMRAWRLRVLNKDGTTISIKQAIIRFYCSLAGIGNLWVLFDFKNRQSLQDYAAQTRTVELSKEANKQVYREL